jgi:predicted dehydrogenase
MRSLHRHSIPSYLLAIQSYAEYALSNPSACKVVTIAEPRPKSRALFAETHSVEQGLVFNTWQELYKASKERIESTGQRLADALIVAVHDHMHVEVVLAFADQGYHILCEKPMATNLEDCIKMEVAVKKAGIIFGMGHGMVLCLSCLLD